MTVPWPTGRGLLAAALTPLRSPTDVDFDAFDAQLHFIAAQQPLGISVAGVEVQDYHVLDLDQRVDLVRHATSRTALPVVAGVSHPSAAVAARLTGWMAEAGATAVIALAAQKPWGAPPTSAESVAWFTELADASPVPVVLYNNPRAGVDLPVDAMAQICAHPNVCALKETSRDIGKTLRLCTTIDRAGHAGVFTNMESLHATLLAGGRGAMLPPPGLAVANDVVRAAAAGDHDAAAEHQRVFADFPGRWMRLGLGPVMKASMALLGCPVGQPVPPFEGLNDDELAQLRLFLDAHVRTRTTVS